MEYAILSLIVLGLVVAVYYGAKSDSNGSDNLTGGLGDNLGEDNPVDKN